MNIINRRHLKIIIMKSSIKIVLATSLAIFSFAVATAQQPGFSDISISTMSITAAGAIKKVPAKSDNSNPTGHAPVTTVASSDILKCSITVNNGSNAIAYGAKLLVLIPAGANMTLGSLPSNAKLVSDPALTRNGSGYISIDLSVIYPNTPLTVEFTFGKSGIANRLSAFVYSIVPDANPDNNYKDAVY